MKKIAVVYQSTFSHTKTQAEAVVRGVLKSNDLDVRLINVTEMGDEEWQFIHDARGIIMGTPTYFGSLSAKFKAFMEKTGDIWAKQAWSGKLAAGFTCSDCASGDKLQVLNQLFLFAAQHGMNWINLGLMPGNIEKPNDSENLNRLGSWVGAMAQQRKASGDVYLCDLKTAEHLGERVANAVAHTLK